MNISSAAATLRCAIFTAAAASALLAQTGRV